MKDKLNNPPYSKKTTFLRIFGNIVFSSLIVITFIVVGFNFFYEYLPVEGLSMYPTLNSSDRVDAVYINHLNKGDIGDIIVCKHDDILVIKRLIAKSGDKISITYENSEFKIFIIENGESVEKELILPFEIIINSSQNTYANFMDFLSKNLKATQVINEKIYYTVPENHIFYLGDNFNSSNDCADYGPILEENIVGTVRYIIYNRKYTISQIITQTFKKPASISAGF